jgi:hypothetical protein
VPRTEGRKDARKDVDARRRAGADRQRATRETVELRDRLPSIRDHRHDAARVALEHSSCLGQGCRPAASREQRCAKFLFELSHVLGHRRLRQVDALGRAGEALLARNGQEDFDLAHCQRHRQSSPPRRAPHHGSTARLSRRRSTNSCCIDVRRCGPDGNGISWLNSAATELLPEA